MVLLKIAVFSFLASVMVTDPSELVKECGDIVVSADVVAVEEGLSKVILTAKGGQSPYKYIFYKQSGELISENFDTNTVNGLEKGKYFCTIVDRKYCKKTIEIEIK